MKSRAKDSVPKMYSFFLWLYSFLMVVQLIQNIHIRTTEFVQVSEKMKILLQTAWCKKSVAKDSVPKMYSFFLWLYSFSMIVQLFNDCTAFKNIHMRTTEFVELWKKLHILVQTPLSWKFMSQGQCTKDLQLFLWFYSFLKIYI